MEDGRLVPTCPISVDTARVDTARRQLCDARLSASPQRAADPHLLGADGARHGAHRRQLDLALARLAPGLEQRIAAQAAACLRAARGDIDLVRAIALPASTEMVAHLLAVGAPEASLLVEGARAAAMLGAAAPRDRIDLLTAVREFDQWMAFLGSTPSSGGLFEPLQRALGERIAASIVRIVVIGSVETTTRLLATTLRHALENPTARDEMQMRPATVAGFVERMAAAHPPLRYVHRSDDGRLVRVSLEAAPRGHLAFGAGPHRCPGARLARSAVRTVLHTCLPHLERWQLLGFRRSRTGQLGGDIEVRVCLPT